MAGSPRRRFNRIAIGIGVFFVVFYSLISERGDEGRLGEKLRLKGPSSRSLRSRTSNTYAIWTRRHILNGSFILGLEGGSQLYIDEDPESEYMSVETLAGTGRPLEDDDDAMSLLHPFHLAVSPSDEIYFIEPELHQVRKVDQAGNLYRVAGTGKLGYADGASGIAMFDTPHGIAVDRLGTVYVADTGNHRIRAISEQAVTTFAGWHAPGYQDGLALASQHEWELTAKLTYPYGVCVDNVGNMHVADTFNNCYRWITYGARVTEAGEEAWNGFYPIVARSIGGIPILQKRDSNRTIVKWKKYWMFTIDREPHYIASAREDQIMPPPAGFRCILSPPPRPKALSGCFVHTLAGRGSFADRDGIGTRAEFMWPQAVAPDLNGGLYGTIHEVHHKIKHISRNGTVTTLAGSEVYGSADGLGTEAEFHAPYNIATDKFGNIFVADTFNNLIRKVTPGGNVTTIAGQRRDKTISMKEYINARRTTNCIDGHPSKARFHLPYGIAVDSKGNVYVADTMNNRIRKICIRKPYPDSGAKIPSIAHPLDDTLSNSSSLVEASVEISTESDHALESSSGDRSGSDIDDHAYDDEDEDGDENDEDEMMQDENIAIQVQNLKDRLAQIQQDDELAVAQAEENGIENAADFKPITKRQKVTLRKLKEMHRVSTTRSINMKAIPSSKNEDILRRIDRGHNQDVSKDDDESIPANEDGFV